MLNVKESVLLQGYAKTGVSQVKDQHIIEQGYFSSVEPPPGGNQIDVVDCAHHGFGGRAGRSLVGHPL